MRGDSDYSYQTDDPKFPWWLIFALAGLGLGIWWLVSWCQQERLIDRANEAAEGNPTAVVLSESRTIWVFDLRPGHCVSSFKAVSGPSSDTEEAYVVPCSGSWAFRVENTFVVDAGGPYPGEMFLANQAAERCNIAANFYMSPTQDSWDRGDRVVTCMYERG